MRAYLCAFVALLPLFIGSTRAKAQTTKPHANKVHKALQVFDHHIARMHRRFQQQPAKPKDVEWVKKKLAHMVDVDQYLRRYTSTPTKQKFSQRETTLFWKLFGQRWAQIDKHNTSELKKLLKFHSPWLTISQFGKRTSGNAWLIVQHADRDRPFQKRILKILAKLYKKGECAPKRYAYLYDRVAALGDARPQRYGTQGRCVGKGRWAPFPIEDEQKVDVRRKEVGLSTLKAYKQRFTKMCHGVPSIHRPKALVKKAFFHLHQALGHLESWAMMKALKKPQCRRGWSEAKKHFRQAPQRICRDVWYPLLDICYRLQGVFLTKRTPTIPTIASWRMALHDLAQKQKWTHPGKWHQAFTRCRKARTEP